MFDIIYNSKRIFHKFIRLADYDYSQNGAYFLTLCTKFREPLFGEICPICGTVKGAFNYKTVLNEFGVIVQEEWYKSADIRKEIYLDEFVIMPDHIHGIVIIKKDEDVAGNLKTPCVTGYQKNKGVTGDRKNKGVTGDRPVAHTFEKPVTLTKKEVVDHTVTVERTRDGKAAPKGPKSKSIASFVGGFKSAVTTRINELRGTPGCPVWLRNYYEHVVRNEEDLNRIRQYIVNNPAKWGLSG